MTRVEPEKPPPSSYPLVSSVSALTSTAVTVVSVKTFICPSAELTWVSTWEWSLTFSYFEVKKGQQLQLNEYNIRPKYNSWLFIFTVFPYYEPETVLKIKTKQQ